MDWYMPNRREKVRRVAQGRFALLATVEPATRAACVDALAQVGMSVTVVGSGVDAVIAARHQLPDLLLIDAQLEDVPGQQAIGWLRGNPALADRPVVLMVDRGGSAAQIDQTKPGWVLRKPVSETALIDLIGTLLPAQGTE